MAPAACPSDRLVEHHRALARRRRRHDDGRLLRGLADGRTFAEQMCMRAGDRARRCARSPTPCTPRARPRRSSSAHCGWFTQEHASSAGAAARARRSAFNAYGLMAGMPFALRDDARPRSRATVDEFGARGARSRARRASTRSSCTSATATCSASSSARRPTGAATSTAAASTSRAALAARGAARACAQRGRRRASRSSRKTNLRDGFRGGLELDDAVGVAQRARARRHRRDRAVAAASPAARRSTCSAARRRSPR